MYHSGVFAPSFVFGCLPREQPQTHQYLFGIVVVVALPDLPPTLPLLPPFAPLVVALPACLTSDYL